MKNSLFLKRGKKGVGRRKENVSARCMKGTLALSRRAQNILGSAHHSS